MKIRASIPGSYMVMEMDEERAHKTFRKIVELLCISGDRVTSETGADKSQVPIIAQEEVEESEVVLYEKIENKPNEPDPSTFSIGYGGFLYIKCPDCGKIKGFCAKARLSNFRCDCGSVTKLENMVPLYMNCECGRNSRYLTNMDEPAFDIVCYDCGNPVAVAWNEHKRQYETIRG